MISRENLLSASWRKSSYSSDNGGNCLEVADGFAGVVPVRDSKAPHGPALVVPAPHWSAFVQAVRNDTLSA
ncbi:DUF397 domain-containing protein [Streptomyces sp. TRM 70351]|uniref:DUF397 domain-containing protein n=1 Tax=Streptomyces sp. TRM 70351 TaxID=3116552 RepID=UPI002E7C564B|nr:DUF397 domain-containing protein [Streptomyces sp. TRM 70351]MEE1928243.1 DUF397 domain-containing protein [Streptomyces sp. TRM 70351]